MNFFKNVADLCTQILNMSLNFYDNPNGGYKYTCPICNESIEIPGNVPTPTMTSFNHRSDCGYSCKRSYDKYKK